MHKYILLFFYVLTYSQSQKLTIFSSNKNIPLEEVLLYNEEKFLGQTNERGEIFINKDFNKLFLVKENYEDAEYSLSEVNKLNWTIKLNPTKVTHLDSVVLISTKENPESILSKIKDSRQKQSRRRFVYYQSKVEFKCNSSFIYSFNNIIYPCEELKANNDNKIIYKGYKKQDLNNNQLEVYKISNKEAQLPIQSSIYCSLTDYAITPIFEGKEYEYSLEQTDDFYILNFYPKKKNPKLLYEGYFIIDKYDYGIIELNMTLFKSKNNFWFTNSYNLSKTYEYKIIEDHFNFKFSRIDGNYFLEKSHRNMTCTQIKGEHIEQIFSFQFNNEETLNHKGLTYKTYDFINNKFKE